MRLRELDGAIVLVAVLVLGACGKGPIHPTCDEAINVAATRHGNVRGLGLGSASVAIAACENEHWPVALRVCIRDAVTQTMVRDCIVSGVSGQERPEAP